MFRSSVSVGHVEGKCTGRSDSPTSLKLTFTGPAVSRTLPCCQIEHVPRQMLYKAEADWVI